MLDLVFLALMVITLVKAIKGNYNELLCNISLVIGVLAGTLGIISAFFGDINQPFLMGILNVLVIVIAFFLRPAAQHFAQLYQNKLDEQQRLIEKEIERARANSQRGFVRDASYINAEPSAGAQGAFPGNQSTNGFGAQSAFPGSQSTNGLGAQGAFPGDRNANGLGAQGAFPGNQTTNGSGAQGAFPGDRNANGSGAQGAFPGDRNANGSGAQSAFPGNQSTNGFGAQGAFPGNQTTNGLGAQSAFPGSQSANGLGAQGNDVLPKK